LRVQGSGFRVQGLGFGFGFGVECSVFRIWGFGLRAYDLRFGVEGSGCEVEGLGFRFQVSDSRFQV